MKKLIYAIALLTFSLSCAKEEAPFDATGSFEADETIISAEAMGKILYLNMEEGIKLKANQLIGIIDTSALFLKKKQLLSQIKAGSSRFPDIKLQTQFYEAQINVVQTKMDYVLNEKVRIEKLIKANAIPVKQLDDINAQINDLEQQLLLINKQKQAAISVLQTQTKAIQNEPLPLYVQIEQIEDQINKSKIINPTEGVVLSQYAKSYEITNIGKPLYKIADIKNISLRAYVTGEQLPLIKLGQKVKVLTDNGKSPMHIDNGTIYWISSQAEFTPKTIQTKNERANLVYAIKVKLINDGRYKIGMYGEIQF
jgi:HlyD family secretion protein